LKENLLITESHYRNNDWQQRSFKIPAICMLTALRRNSLYW